MKVKKIIIQFVENDPGLILKGAGSYLGIDSGPYVNPSIMITEIQTLTKKWIQILFWPLPVIHGYDCYKEPASKFDIDKSSDPVLFIAKIGSYINKRIRVLILIMTMLWKWIQIDDYRNMDPDIN